MILSLTMTMKNPRNRTNHERRNMKKMIITVSVIVCLCFGFAVGRVYDDETYRTFATTQITTQSSQITKVIVANTEIMQESGLLFGQIKQNADTMMRYNHYLNGHDPSVKKTLFCPECFTEEDTPEELSKHFITEFEDHPEEVPETFEQILKDCEEIKTSIQRAKSSLQSQSITLQRTLDKLRTQNEGTK